MSRKVSVAALAALFAWVVICLWDGIDFGRHWDERYNVIRTARRAVVHGTVLPGWYYFPSLLHDLTLLAATPDLAVLEAGGEAAPAAALERVIDSPPFLLRMRRIASFLASLTIVWVFLTVLVWRDRPLEALLAAGIAAGSWELHYHSRWLAPDALVAQFGALTLLLSVHAARRGSLLSLRAAAAAAALACGTKYPGGALLIPVMAACTSVPRGKRRVAEVLGIFAAVFLVTTPGALLEPRLFLDNVSHHVVGYSAGLKAQAYAVDAPFEHLRLLATYVGLVQLSHYVPLALALTAAAAGGVAWMWRNERRLAPVVTLFPLAFLLYFAMQRSMAVRNVLVVIPFLSVAAAVGISVLFERALRSATARRIAAAGVAIALAANLAWLAVAARSISASQPVDYIAAAAAFLDSREPGTVALSRGVARVLREYDGRERKAVPVDAPSVDTVLVFAGEIPWAGHRANRWNYTDRWFGPFEVNFNYYPTWAGRDRILVMPGRNFPRPRGDR